MFRKYRDSIKSVATLAKIQNAREAFPHLTLMSNCQTFIVTCLCLTFTVKVECFPVFCARIFGVVAVVLLPYFLVLLPSLMGL